MAIESFDEVKDYFTNNAENEDVKSYVKGFTNLDGVKDFLNNSEDGKQYMNNYSDSKVTKGIESYKTNNFEKEYQERYTKDHPSKTPEILELQKQLQLMKDENIASKKDLAHRTLSNKALQMAQEGKLPAAYSKFIDKFIGDDEASTVANVKEFVAAFNTESLKTNAYVPPTGSSVSMSAIDKARAEIRKGMGFKDDKK